MADLDRSSVVRLHLLCFAVGVGLMAEVVAHRERRRVHVGVCFAADVDCARQRRTAEDGDREVDISTSERVFSGR
jgi:hypothetical protein